MSNTPHAKTLKKTTQRRLPSQREMDREKLNRGGRNAGNPKRHDGQTDDRLNAQRGSHHDDHNDWMNDNYR